MPQPKDVYVNCDVMENIPIPNRDNYLKEIELLRHEFSANAQILQVGSMDGSRVIRLLEARPDLKITGLEIEADLVEFARQNLKAAGLYADFIQGDITAPPTLPHFDYVICLNNTLGYIPDQTKAIENMKQLGQVIISVYGEKFIDDLALSYFKSIHLDVNQIKNDFFIMKDFTTVKRYSKIEVESWGGKIIDTPIGYLCMLKNKGA